MDVCEDALIETRDETPTWFRFLLDDKLLETRLRGSSDVTLAATFISTFHHQVESSMGILRDIRVSENLFGEVETPENSENNRIQCLKLLAIKAASFVCWDLDYMYKYVPANYIHTLLLHLVKLTTSRDAFQLLSSDLNIDSLSSVALFALNLYCCWSLNFIVNESMPSKPSKVPHVQIPGLFDPCTNLATTRESILKILQENEEGCIVVLEKILTSRSSSSCMPVMKCFSLKTEDGRMGECDWSLGLDLPTSEIYGQASYSLGCLCFLRKKYHLALSAFECCHALLVEVTNPIFMKVKPAKVDGYLSACRGILKIPVGNSKSLHEKVIKCCRDNFQGLNPVLVEDLEKQELSVCLRCHLEDRLVADLPSKKNIYLDVLVCNSLRKILKGNLVALQFVRNAISFHGIVTLLKMICCDICYKIPKQQQVYLKEFLMYLAKVLPHSVNIKELLFNEPMKQFFTEVELQSMSTQAPPPITTNSYLWSQLNSSSEASRIVNLEYKLLTCNEAPQINEMVYSLIGIVAKYNLLFLSDRWHLPMELHSTLESISLTNPHLSTLFNTLVAKARICSQLQMFQNGRELLDYADMRLRDTTFYKLMKLLKWELLAMDLSAIFDKKSQKYNSSSDLIDRAKNCLTSVHLETDLQPSAESLRLSILHLLNNEEWEFLISISSANELVQFGQMVGGLCKEINQLKTARTLARNFIEFIALSFSTPSKRPLPGVISKDCLLDFISMISNETILSVFISCITKLLRFADQGTNGDIFSDYVVFWPSAINNTMLDKSAILESVQCILDRAMTVNSNNTSWIRTRADLCFALKQYHSALKYYIFLGVVGTDYFSEPLTKNTFDDQVYRRMIQACIHLNCFMQAAVMCQFLDEVDYSTAFKCISERPIFDGGDSYYGCIWDATILEYIINNHQRNSEMEKLNYARHLMKAPEMNSNRKPEAFLEISKVKRKRFLRKMANHYIKTVDVL